MAVARPQRLRALLFVFAAAMIAAGTGYTVYQIVRDYERALDAARAEIATHQVVVATVDIVAGQEIGPDQVAEVERPGAEDDPRAIVRLEQVLGRMAGERILAGEVVRVERLDVTAPTVRLDELIDAGSRAITLRTSREAALGGLLFPGVYVDVIVTIRPEGEDAGPAERVTETVLQGAKVVAIGDDRSPTRVLIDERADGAQADRPPREVYVTVEVQPAEAEGVALAVSQGDVHLALRAKGDLDPLPSSPPLVTNALVGLPKLVETVQTERLERKRVHEARKERVIMEIIRGRDVSREEVQGEGRVR